MSQALKQELFLHNQLFVICFDILEHGSPAFRSDRKMLFQHFISFTVISMQSHTSVTCPICVPSVVFLAVLHIIACKTNQGDKCLFTCLPTELVSSKESQATAIFITTKNGEVQNHSSKTWHYLYINKLHIVLTLQVIFTRVEQTCCKVFPVDIQIATFGVASCKYLFFNLTPLTAGFSSFFLQLLQLLKQSERRFWHTSPNFDNHGVQNCLRNTVFILPSP